MKIKIANLVLFSYLFLFVGIVYAVQTAPPPNSNEDLFKWIIGGLCSAFFTICTAILVKVDKNQSLLFKFQRETNDEVIKLQTQIGLCSCCNHEDSPEHHHKRVTDTNSEMALKESVDTLRRILHKFETEKRLEG